MQPLIEAVRADASPEELLNLPLPSTYRAAHLLASEVNIFQDATDKDVRRSLHVGEVPMPEIEPDEVVVAVMSAAINFNTVWSAMFEPIPTFKFLAGLAKQGTSYATRHHLPYHVLGSDASGVIVRTGSAVRRWSVGDKVVVHPVVIDHEDPTSQDDAMLTKDMRAWGFETNFGGLADFTVVKASQLMPKAEHLTWEEAACVTFCGTTAYRMLVSPNGAQMKQGDVVFIWGATGGLGAFAVQLVRNGGGIPVGAVSSAEKAELARKLGCAGVVNLNELKHYTRNDEPLSKEAWFEIKDAVVGQVGEKPHIVFEYIGRSTFGASVIMLRKGGKIVTCGSSSGYVHEYDNRYLWMHLKDIIGSHGANYQEAWETNRLVQMGMLIPPLSRTYDLPDVGEAVRAVQTNQHVGKIAVRCLASETGLGIQDHKKRERIGEEKLRLFGEF